MRSSPAWSLDGTSSPPDGPMQGQRSAESRSRSFDLGPNPGYGAIPEGNTQQRSTSGDNSKGEQSALLPRKDAQPQAPPLVPLPESVFVKSSSTCEDEDDEEESGGRKKGGIVLYLIYSCINIIMCVPCLYGYASVIFNNDAYQPYINTLSKLVLWSSIIHQCCFSYFSSLNFSIGQVQDAGLIFLSGMANRIAYGILADGGTAEEIVSTAIVVLGIATATLGVLLVLMGKYRLADAVAYLPLPVVGGYLAFIGYFCFEAGVALCISKSIVQLPDWVQIFNKEALLLAFPGIIAGGLITYTSRNAKSDAALPLVMVSIPVTFYILIYAIPGYGLEGARTDEWVGATSPPIPPQDVFKLIEFDKVKWEYIRHCIPTWAGMVFVVSFSSCLDVAAISMDMGEPLDTNNELMTVGISNVISGVLCGFTGSYIFSQTIFVYRTKCDSRWIGIFTAIGETAVFVCTVNVLEVTPLFFLGATLIFIGFDLMYEWLVEVRHKLLLTEYCVLLATFVAIQIVGIDGGIIFGIFVAVVDYVVKTAKVSTLSRVSKRSRAVWKPEEWKLLQDQGYHMQNPKIVTLEVKGSVFFGSSLQLLNRITNELNISATKTDRMEMMSLVASPRHRKPLTSGSSGRRNSSLRNGGTQKSEQRLTVKSRTNSKSNSTGIKTQPLFVVLDLSLVTNLDASAARGCFLQLAKMCEKRGIVACASGADTRVDWMLRSHDCAYSREEEGEVKAKIQVAVSPMGAGAAKLLLFQTLYEALEFCENNLIQKIDSGIHLSQLGTRLPPKNLTASGSPFRPRQSLAEVFSHYLGKECRDMGLLKAFESGEGRAFHEEMNLNSGDVVFTFGDASDSFFVVLAGSVAMLVGDQKVPKKGSILSGAGRLKVRGLLHSFSEKSGVTGEVKKYLKVGGIFGYVDFMLDQPRTFATVAARDGTIVAKLHRTGINRIKSENPELERTIDKVLLQASALELANVIEP